MSATPGVAVSSAVDLHAQALRLAHRREATLAGAAPAGVRPPIAASWRRCSAAGLDPERALAPRPLSAEEAAERWARHPLRAVLEPVRSLLAHAREEAGQVALFCDADGTLLWLEGDPRLREQGHAVNLVLGSCWSERVAGTNAMGTALAERMPLQVFSSEHYVEAVGGWACSAAPVHDPCSGDLLGVLDLSGDMRTAHPHTLTVVAAAARVAEAALGELAAGQPPGRRHGATPTPNDLREMRLRTVAGVSDRQPMPATAAAPALHLRAFGPRPPELSIGVSVVPLARRHAELLTLLLLRPQGWSAERLALELLGDHGKPVTVRAELSRLRRLLGGRVSSPPYRLLGPADADFAAVERLLDAGEAGEALLRYGGELLPFSEAPAIVEARHRLELALRAAVLESDDPSLLERWLRTPSGADDEPACRRLLTLTGATAAAHALALGRLRAGRGRVGPSAGGHSDR